MERLLFDNNKIVEALCQFTFKPLQDNTVYGQYWDAVLSEGKYTQKENVTAVNFAVDGTESAISPTLVNAMRFTNEKKSKIVQLHNNNISIHQVSKYEKWEVFKEDIDSAIAAFNKITDTVFIERIDLRTINVFDFPIDDFSLKEYFNVSTVAPDYLKHTNENITLEFPLSKENCFAVLRLKTSYQNKMNVVLDISFVNIETNIETKNVQTITEILQFGHDELYKLFTSVITEKTKKLIQ